MNFRLTIDGQRPIEGVFNAAQPFTPPVIKNRVAIVSDYPAYFSDPDWKNEVNTTPLHDTIHPTKGHTVPAYPSVLRHMRKIQSEVAYNWTMRPFMLWPNRRYVGDSFGPPWVNEDGSPLDENPATECITGWGNFMEIIGEVGEYYEIKATAHTTDFDKFDTSFNWFNYPCLWVKQSARNRKIPPDMQNVGSGYDAYFPLLKAKAGLWIFKKHVEVLPPSPDGGYVLQGMSVYTAGMQPLRLARKPGELIYPTSWRINTAGVIPQAVT